MDSIFETEHEWQYRLKSILELGYGHTVYDEMNFINSVDKDRGRLDLYVQTNEEWEHHGLFPVVGIECKLLDRQGMGWLISSRDQMKRYMNTNNIYSRDGKRHPLLNICLVATPESFHEGVVYKWGGLVNNKKAAPCCWHTMTYIFQRILLREKCSILLEKRFQSNIEGGAIKNYYLGA